MSNYSVVATEDVAAIHQLYGHQSHCIDSGRQQDWAVSFIPPVIRNPWSVSTTLRLLLLASSLRRKLPTRCIATF